MSDADTQPASPTQPASTPGGRGEHSALSPLRPLSEASTQHSYQIGAASYRLEPASFAQHQWLGEGPLRGIDMGKGLTELQLEPIIQRQGPELLGIALIVEGQTREQKARAGKAAALELAETIRCTLTPDEVRAIAHDFFIVNGHRNCWFFIDFPALAARTPAAPTPTGPTPASVSSPEATSPSGSGSDSTPVLLTPSATSAGSSSGS